MLRLLILSLKKLLCIDLSYSVQDLSIFGIFVKNDRLVVAAHSLYGVKASYERIEFRFAFIIVCLGEDPHVFGLTVSFDLGGFRLGICNRDVNLFVGFVADLMSFCLTFCGLTCGDVVSFGYHSFINRFLVGIGKIERFDLGDLYSDTVLGIIRVRFLSDKRC